MRLLYFKQLIGKFKKHQKQSTNSEEEESMMLDYLVKMQDSKNCGEPTYFSGMLSSKSNFAKPFTITIEYQQKHNYFGSFLTCLSPAVRQP